MEIKGDDTYALIVVGDHARDEYVRLLSRLGLAADAFRDTSAAARSLRAHPPAVSILEVEDGGCALLRELRDRFGPDTPVVLVSAVRTSPADVVAGLLVGADDYAAESMDADEFIARVRRLIDRTRRAPTATADLRRLSALTDRERQVLALLSEGLSQKQLAAELGISVKTVGAHVQNLLSKLGLHSRLEAVAFAMRAGAMVAPLGVAVAALPGPVG
ncbi:MAG TPA: response regulator transcription factor [Microbacterium sp.]|nr:response regulator transcription factor [Microbacterium sp.]